MAAEPIRRRLSQYQPVWLPYGQVAEDLTTYFLDQFGLPQTGKNGDAYRLAVASLLKNAQRVAQANKGMTTDHPYYSDQLDAAIDHLRAGDKLVVLKLDRLARNVTHMGKLLEEIEAKGAGLVILSLGSETVDTTTATGKLILNMMVSVAQFEREMMLERQKEGIAKAKEQGKYKGRKPTAQQQADKVLALKSAGVPRDKIQEQLGISRASYYRIVASA